MLTIVIAIIIALKVVGIATITWNTVLLLCLVWFILVLIKVCFFK